jgi:inosine/xanthosine triphosphatase
MIYRIFVASKNPVKIESARIGFSQVFPGVELDMQGVSVPSGVAEQPQTDHETLLGAQNRLEAVRALHPDADFWAGIEGGIDRLDGGMVAFAWIVIQNQLHTGRARTGTFFLPDRVIELIDQGIELGEADDIVFNRSGSKTGNGAIGILTNDIIDRTGLYTPAVIMALVPFINPDLYQH